MKLKRNLILLAVLLLTSNMLLATQYAVTKIGYEYYLVHPSDSNIRYIGSDNTTGGRVLRMTGGNTTGVIKLILGNWSVGTNKMYSAAFGIVNEEAVALSITHINISSTVGYSYMNIWLHGNRTANANSTVNDPTTVLMVSNGSTINATDTNAWTLAPGNDEPYNMCSNVSDRTNCSTNTTWDSTANVRYSLNDTVAYGVGMNGRTINNASDYVWVQIGIDIPTNVDTTGIHSGNIWIHYKATTES